MVTTLGKRRKQTDNSSLAWRVRCDEESLECLFRMRTGLLLGNPPSQMQLTHEMQNNTDQTGVCKIRWSTMPNYLHFF